MYVQHNAGTFYTAFANAHYNGVTVKESDNDSVAREVRSRRAIIYPAERIVPVIINQDACPSSTFRYSFRSRPISAHCGGDMTAGDDAPGIRRLTRR
jgi:hypothetical protein